MLSRTGLALLAIVACGSPTASPTSLSQPTVFGHSDGSGDVSPARCNIVYIGDPHVSTYMKAMHNVEQIKGNARAACDHAVDELTLSVSIFDAGTHQELIKGPPGKNQGQSSLKNFSTAVDCINTNKTSYQIGVLGTSYEQGHEYTEVKFSPAAEEDCGHA